MWGAERSLSFLTFLDLGDSFDPAFEKKNARGWENSRSERSAKAERTSRGGAPAAQGAGVGRVTAASVEQLRDMNDPTKTQNEQLMCIAGRDWIRERDWIELIVTCGCPKCRENALVRETCALLSSCLALFESAALPLAVAKSRRAAAKDSCQKQGSLGSARKTGSLRRESAVTEEHTD